MPDDAGHLTIVSCNLSAMKVLMTVLLVKYLAQGAGTAAKYTRQQV